MLVKTSELMGKALNIAVSMAKGFNVSRDGSQYFKVVDGREESFDVPDYFRDWKEAGSIIEEEGITVGPHTTSPFIAHYGPSAATSPWRDRSIGPSPLVSAMRCFVTYKLGGTVDLHEDSF